MTKRAKCMHAICEKMTLIVGDDDHICSIEAYWSDRCLGALCDALLPDEFYPVETAAILPVSSRKSCAG